MPTNDPARMVAFTDLPEPEPKPNEAVVAVDAFSINRGETFLLERPPAGWRPGKDIAGTVVRAAADGTGPAAGARVVGHPASAGWAERAAVPVRQLALLPDGIDSTLAAGLPLAGLTALRLLRAAGSVAGRRVLITGASGGVGHMFVELAAAAAAHITACAGSDERGKQLLQLGASRVIHHVADAANGMDLVLESVGGDSFVAALGKLAPRGQLIWFGEASRTAPQVDFFSFFDGHQSAVIRHFDYTDSDTTDGEDLATLVRLVAGGRLHPEIGIISSWSETPARISDLRARRIRGKAILRVDA